MPQEKLKNRREALKLRRNKITIIQFPQDFRRRLSMQKTVAKERKREFEISRISRFRYRTRYFTKSAIIGSKEFVAARHRRLFFTLHNSDKIFILLLIHKMFINSNLTGKNMDHVNQRFLRL
jgi:hypothetical protein